MLSVDVSDDCQTVMTFYATSLQSVVGPHFKAPDVVYLARQWLDASSTLFSALRHCGVLMFGYRRVASCGEDLVRCRRGQVFRRGKLCTGGRLATSSSVTRPVTTIVVLTWVKVPCLQPSADQDSKQSGLALFLCGYMTIEKYSLLSTRCVVCSPFCLMY